MNTQAEQPFTPPDFTAMNAEQMNDWYEQTVGYRPQVDAPETSEEELRELCISYAQARTEADPA